jgi:hypothetical protein
MSPPDSQDNTIMGPLINEHKTITHIKEMKSKYEQEMMKTKKKNVSFARTAKYRRCLRREDYNAKECEASWYSHEEMNMIKAEIKATLRMMEACELDDGEARAEHDGYCRIGLEARTLLGAQQKRNTRRRAYNAVLEEQSLQYAEEFSDPEALAFVYRECSVKSQDDAHRAGLEMERLLMVQRRGTKKIQVAGFGSYLFSRVQKSTISRKTTPRPKYSKAA